MTELIQKFKASGTTIRPYWLSPSFAKLNASGLLGEEAAWATASEQLYVLCWKIDVEDQRRNTMMSGYEWWLIQVNPKPSSSPSALRFVSHSTSPHLSGLLDRFERRNGYLSQRECSNGRLGL